MKLTIKAKRPEAVMLIEHDDDTALVSVDGNIVAHLRIARYSAETGSYTSQRNHFLDEYKTFYNKKSAIAYAKKIGWRAKNVERLSTQFSAQFCAVWGLRYDMMYEYFLEAR